MKRIKVLLAAVGLAAGMVAVAPSPATACPDGACAPCYVRPPVVNPEGGTITMPRYLIECYY